MDISKFKTHDWLMVGGGAGMLVFGLFPWVRVSFGGLGDSANAFDFTWTGTIPWILLVAVGVVAFLLAAQILKSDTAPWPVILLGVAALATLLVLIRLIFNPIEGASEARQFGASVSRQFGLFLATAAAIAATVGAYMNFTASGGNLAELGKSMQSKVGSGNSSSDSPPPPPPPADAPPPPPPPAP